MKTSAETLALDLNLGDLDGLPPGINLGGAADLAASGHLNVDLDFGFDVGNFDPLDPLAHIYIFNTTGIDAGLNADGTNWTSALRLGPSGFMYRAAEAHVDADAALSIDPIVFAGKNRVSLDLLMDANGGILDIVQMYLHAQAFGIGHTAALLPDRVYERGQQCADMDRYFRP